MRNRSKLASILGGSAIAMLALGLAMLHWVRDEALAADTPREALRGAAARADHGRLPARQWIPGTTYIYEIESSRALTMQRDHGPGQPRELAVSGRLSIAVVGPAADGDGALLRLALAGAASPRLSGAFYAVAAPTGRLGSFSFPRGLGGADRATLKGLAGALQVVVPDPGAASWRATEEDLTGEYEAAYRADGDAIHKAKERFVRARGARGLTPIKDPSTYEIASSIELALEASGWPRTASEDETLAVKAGAMQIQAKTRTSARLAAVEQTPDLARIAAAEQAVLEAEPAADAEGFAAAKRRADEGLLDGASYQALLADLAAGDAQLRNRTLARLAALFRLQPEAAARAAGSLLGGGLTGEAAQRMIGALGSAGTPEAQRALASVLGSDRASSELRSDAAAALGRTKQPTEDSKQALLKAARASDGSLASTATLGLGNLIKRMDEGSGDASDAVAALIQRLAAATDDAERLLCLDALGNSGDPRALSAIEPYLAAGDVKLRAAAAQALRFMAGADARVAAALQDLAPEVRRAAAGALAYRAITPMLSLVSAVLQHDADVSTRLQLVSALKLRKRQEPGLGDLLSWSAANDPAAEVRSAAKTAIASPM